MLLIYVYAQSYAQVLWAKLQQIELTEAFKKIPLLGVFQ
jgi:hypothetical protein